MGGTLCNVLSKVVTKQTFLKDFPHWLFLTNFFQCPFSLGPVELDTLSVVLLAFVILVFQDLSLSRDVISLKKRACGVSVSIQALRSSEITPSPSTAPSRRVGFHYFAFLFKQVLNISPPSGILWLCISTFLKLQKLVMVNLTVALKRNRLPLKNYVFELKLLNIFLQFSSEHPICYTGYTGYLYLWDPGIFCFVEMASPVLPAVL